MKNNIFERIKSLPIIIIMSVATILATLYLSISYGELKPVFIGIIGIICVILILWAYSFIISKGDKDYRKIIASLNATTLDFFMNFTLPVAILNGDGKILWCNKTFSAISGTKISITGQNINDIALEKISLRRLYESSPEELAQKPVTAVLGDEKYEIYPYNLTSSDKHCYLTVWNSQKKLNELQTFIENNKPVVSYIAVDNYSETAGFMQTNYRTITAKISIILKEWAESINGILREVESDRYILIFEKQYLSEIKEKKFDILDTVREISTDNVEIPVTISIGCAATDGSMSEKEVTAHQALDLALQRGGDQAVLKYQDGTTQYFGGRTKTVQKRTKIRSRIIATEAMNLMKNSSNVIIMGHKFADHDSFGSCIGMARFAMQYSDKVNIVVNIHDKNLKPFFQKLRGLSDYQDVFIDGVSAQDLITSDTLLIITDVNNVRQFEAPDLYTNVQNVIIIDHHRQSAEFAIKPKITYIEPSASSASELVCEMIEQQLPPQTLLKEEAELLFAGMILDTKQFANNTGPRTFSAALFLRGEGANPAEAQMLFRPVLEDFKREIKYEKNAFIYRDIIAFSYIDENGDQNDKIAAAKAADRLLGIEGILASFVLCKIDDIIHISARSSGTVNVQLITEKLGGGGHFDMAGAQIEAKNIKETFVLLKDAIDKYFEELQGAAK